jgi:hypothetical protein
MYRFAPAVKHRRIQSESNPLGKLEMKPSETFGVVVRSVGLVIVVMAGGTLGFALLTIVMGGPASAGGLMILGFPPLCAGLWLLRGAPGLVAFAYPDERVSEWRAGHKINQSEHDR